MPYGYPTDLATLGSQLKKRRLDLELTQREVALLLAVDKATVENWEFGRTQPNVRAWPRVIEFLEYDPRRPGQTIGEKLRRHREGLGLSWAEAAHRMGVDPATVSKWERQSDDRFDHRSIPAVVHFLGFDPLPSPNSLKDCIVRLRYLAGLSQTGLARRLGVGTDVVCQWERGDFGPSTRRLLNLEDATVGIADYLGTLGMERFYAEIEAAAKNDRRFRPRSPYPEMIRTVGDRIRKRRLDLGLSQAALAREFGVNKVTISNWETGIRQPDLTMMAKIVEFLGEDAVPTDGSLAEQIRAKRRALGLKQPEFAKLIGVCTKTMHYWEAGTRLPTGRHLERIQEILETQNASVNTDS